MRRQMPAGTNVDVDQGTADSVEKRRSEYLHVAGQHYKIDITAEQLKLTLFGLGAGVAAGGDMYERHTEGPHALGQIWVVGDNHDNRHLKFAATIAPQQI